MPKIPPFKVIVDTREQLPYEFYSIERKVDKTTGEIVTLRHDWNVERRKLDTGDYSIAGHEAMFCMERKSLSDFYGCVFDERFDRELQRLAEMRHACILIEANYDDATRPEEHGRQIHPEAVIGKIASYELKYGIHVHFASNRQAGQRRVRRQCLLFWKYVNNGELFNG